MMHNTKEKVMNRTIFIIVPIYNVEKYLKQCLESIKNQTLQSFVCIMVNDGSTDNSMTICEEFSKDNHFVLISQENKGVAAARNTGLSYVLTHATENDFLTFIDADDFVNEKYLERFSDAIVSNDNFEIMFCAWNELFTEKTISHKLKNPIPVVSGNFREDFECLDSFLQTLWGNLYNVSLLKERHINFNEKLNLGEDIQFNFTYAYFIQKYVFINECLYNYRNIQTSLSRKNIQTNERISMRFLSFSRRLQFLTTCGIESKNYVIAKHISNITTGTIFNPHYKRLYELKQYAEPKYGRTSGQKRVLFCLKHHLLWVYRFYLKIKDKFS